ncbi:MAG: iron-sulfur cluster repair di-iron protein [Gemmatimonadales bacterium]
MEHERTPRPLSRTVGELVAEDYARASVFAQYGIDFCCGGDRLLARACEEAGVPPESVLQALTELGRSASSHPGPRLWTLARLVAHIEQEHHGYVRRTLPRLRQWTETIARVHGPRHPELAEIEQLVKELEGELESHMRDEETRLFPQIAVREDPGEREAGTIPGALVEALEDDHEHAGELARRIRRLANDFVPPVDACATYTATYALLEEFETDLHRHVHLENNILFPRARARFVQHGTAATPGDVTGGPGPSPRGVPGAGGPAEA